MLMKAVQANPSPIRLTQDLASKPLWSDLLNSSRIDLTHGDAAVTYTWKQKPLYKQMVGSNLIVTQKGLVKGCLFREVVVLTVSKPVCSLMCLLALIQAEHNRCITLLKLKGEKLKSYFHVGNCVFLPADLLAQYVMMMMLLMYLCAQSPWATVFHGVTCWVLEVQHRQVGLVWLVSPVAVLILFLLVSLTFAVVTAV